MRQPRDSSLDYLRATLTLMVVAHHSCLAYTDFARVPPGGPPIVDPSHSLWFDYLENFNDVFFMSAMFFVSGLFVWPSLRRSGPVRFFTRRLWRLGLPFAVGMLTLAPLAYYAAWLAAGFHDGPLVYWRLNVTVHGWPPGPLWFVWLLLLFDAIAAALYLALGRLAAPVAPDRPVWAFAGMLLLCAAAYLPMLAVFGFGHWTTFVTKPFYFQACRVFLYFVWFAMGALAGASDLERGILSRRGALARHWRVWVAFSIVAYNLLIFLPRLPALRGQGEIEGPLWILSCVSSCFGFVALFRGVVRNARPWMESFARSAYAIYLVHYVFVLWMQYALVGQPLTAGVKFVIVFVSATVLSWLSAQALLRLPGAAKVL